MQDRMLAGGRAADPVSPELVEGQGSSAQATLSPLSSRRRGCLVLSGWRQPPARRAVRAAGGEASALVGPAH